MEDKRFGCLRKGNPRILGVTEDQEGYSFALSVPEGRQVSLLLYKKGELEPEREIPLTEQYRMGGVCAISVPGIDPADMEYDYRIDGVVTPDPCAPVLCGLGAFGEMADPGNPHQVRGGFFPRDFSSWEDPGAPQTPYEDTLIYKVHVRGYTMHKNSKVRRKGTFAGLQEKIPYLQELGITALELMPAYEFQEVMIPKEMPLEYAYKVRERFTVNYWGYTKGYYFAPKAAYSASGDPIREFQGLVKALHQAGIECIMEFYFPQECSPLLVLSALRHWKIMYHVDGFHLVGEGVPQGLLAADPLLGQTKLLFEGLGGGPGSDLVNKNLAEYNDGFKEDLRRWLKGDENVLGAALARMRKNPEDHAVVNYMANQDGFTLQDMVCFEKKHNEMNQEDNRDGTVNNYSWNCGAEGQTRKRSVRMLRGRQVKNAFLMVLLSQGVPLIYGGDEFGNSQQGNNNAYCQDNEVGWVDWSRAKRFQELTDFVKEAIAFRREHRVLHMSKEPQGIDYRCLGCPDISYHGQRAWYGDMEPSSRQVGIMYCEGYGREDGDAGAPEGSKGSDQGLIYLACNLYWETQRLALPNIPEDRTWEIVLQTGGEELKGLTEPQIEEDYVAVPSRTILVLLARTADEGGCDAV